MIILAPNAVRSGRLYTTDPATGDLRDGDATPTVTLEVNGVASGISATVTKISTGAYRYSWTATGLSDRDRVIEIRSATVAGEMGVDTVEVLIGQFAVAGDQMNLINAPNAVALSAIGSAVWAALTSGMTTAGSIGKRLVDFFAAYTDGRAAKLDLLGAITGSVAPSTPALNTDITVTANNHYAATFTISGMDSTGWTEMVFAVKADADADDDADALLLVKVANPADGGDGLQTINRHPAATASDATLAVSGVSPDTVLSLTIKAAGLAIPPSSTSKPYLWELVKWTGATKEKIGGAKFKVSRPVVRATAAI